MTGVYYANLHEVLSVCPQLATKTFHDTMFSIRHTTDPMWKATRKTLAQAFTSEAIRCESFNVQSAM